MEALAAEARGGVGPVRTWRWEGRSQVFSTARLPLPFATAPPSPLPPPRVGLFTSCPRPRVAVPLRPWHRGPKSSGPTRLPGSEQGAGWFGPPPRSSRPTSCPLLPVTSRPPGRSIPARLARWREGSQPAWVKRGFTGAEQGGKGTRSWRFRGN